MKDKIVEKEKFSQVLSQIEFMWNYNYIINKQGGGDRLVTLNQYTLRCYFIHKDESVLNNHVSGYELCTT